MIIFKYKNELLRYFIYIFALLISVFIISNIIIKDEIKEESEIKTSIIKYEDDITKLYVEYPRFKDTKINSFVSSSIYSYIKEFKLSNKVKTLNISYDLYYLGSFVNITYNIENSLNNIKNKNQLIDLKNKKIAYINQIYEVEDFKNKILDKVYYKYSKDIYNKVSSSSINNFTYIINNDEVKVYFNNIDFNIDYIPYIEIINNKKVSFEENNYNKYISFTYDDGPSEYTKELIKVLDSNNSSATFFMLGNRMNKYKDIVSKIYNSSSEIGSHSYAHKDLTSLTKEELNEDLTKTNDIYNSITGDNIKYLRPPYIYTNKDVLDSNYAVISWNIDPKDWLNKDSQKIYNEVIKNACDGCIVVLHDIYPTTIEATKMLIPKLNEMGYGVVSISKLIDKKGYKITPGKMISRIK